MPLPPHPASDESHLATRGARLIAAIIDTGILVFALVTLASIGVIALPQDPQAVTFTDSLFVTLQGFALFVMFNTYLLLKHGQTIGKRLLGIRIVSLDGEPLTPMTLIGLRYAIPWLISSLPVLGAAFGLADALFIFSQNRRCLHDLLAGTQVIRDERANEST